MATLTGGSVEPIRMDLFSFGVDFDGDVTGATSTQITLDTGGGYVVTFAGTGFTFNGGGDITGGTLTQVQERLNGNVTYTITGLSTPATQFVQWIETNATETAYSSIFSGNDNLTGNSFADYLKGYIGHDNLFGGAGSDTLFGGAGNDHLYGQSANGGTDGADIINGEGGSDYIQGNAGADTLDGGDGSDRINGGGDNDRISGGSGNDAVNGNLGADSIDGGIGNDSLRGGQGNDTILGGDGNDTISGDLGVDSLSGGAGSDTFLFNGNGALFAGASADVITDFQDGSDRISVGYAVTSVLTGAAQSSFGAAATAAQQLFDGHAGTGEVAAISVGADTYLFYSSSNGAAADSAVQLVGAGSAAIAVADFI